ncbi:AAA family ATPase [Mycolicibacterium arenosum]|uniref:Helicase RepA family protein n=1 Tax=Mycolicibacterium arenosum TaxID=2952157 RepID=A0ABT1M0U9_9MYCO|nr:AAA family ATPase [Mycolicibacterium sp. CAU 1645]MCP9272778.1 helicase RepA family protein [Mycolicibacterium sp. CAU 1645]
MADVEQNLLALMTTPEGMATVDEYSLSANVFEDDRHRIVFEFMRNYWRTSTKVPTLFMIEREYPSIPITPVPEVEETAGWYCEHLNRRYQVNRGQDIIRRAAVALGEEQSKVGGDPFKALTAMRDDLTVTLENSRVVDRYAEEFLDADQLDDVTTPPSLIAGVLPRDVYGILRGRDASFKSFVALDWSLCLATGTPWQDRPAEPVKVLYVAGEGAYGLAERKRSWESAHGVKADADRFVVRRSAVNLFRGGPDFDHLLTYVEEYGFGLVVLDTLRRMSGGANGNSSDMGVVVDNIDRLKRATADGSVLTVSHTDKGDNDSRGFSGIEDDADVVWSVKRPEHTNEVVLTCSKMKDGPDGHHFDLAMRAEGDSLVVSEAGAVAGVLSKDRETDQIIVAVMRDVFAVDGATVKDLIEMTGLSQASIYRSRARLLESGVLISNRAHRLFLTATAEADHG